MNRPNIFGSVRFPDPKLPAAQFNRAAVEIFKQMTKDHVDLRNRVTQLEYEVSVLKQQNQEGARPPIRYMMGRAAY